MVGARQSTPFAIATQSHNNIESAIAKIQCVRMTLRTEANYSADFTAERVKSDLSIAINAYRHSRTEWLMLTAAPN